jgi:anthranilate phosphoribosyltransferase
MLAYILVGLQECDEKAVLDKLLENKEVVEGHLLFGEWDVILKVEVETPEGAGTFVMDNLRNLPEVNITSTLIVAK